eukprot:m.69243 g.69243  ORF g.69243 m.69243 type:complete len:357 (+) comp14110_c0_seq1:153-1223(+)
MAEVYEEQPPLDFSVLKLVLHGDVVLQDCQAQQLRNLMSRYVLKAPVSSMERTDSDEIFVYLDTKEPLGVRKKACERALKDEPLWVDWVPGLTTAIVSDVSADMPSRKLTIDPSLIQPEDGLGRPPIVSRVNFPSPAVSKLLHYDPQLFKDLRDELLEIDQEMRFNLQKAVLTYYHRSADDRASVNDIVNNFVEQRIATTPVTIHPGFEGRVNDLIVPEVKKLAIFNASYYIARAGFDDTKFILSGWPDGMTFSKAAHDQVVRQTELDLFWIKRSRTDRNTHVALLTLGPDRDYHETRRKLLRICEQGSLQVCGVTLRVSRFEIEDTTVTMLRNVANDEAIPFIEAADAALRRVGR